MQPELHINSDIYTNSFPNFSRPKPIGYIGLENLMFLREVKNKSVHFDLNKHIDKVKRKPPNLDVKLNDLLQFLLDNEIRLNISVQCNLENSNIFCYRGLMTCIACTPYENKDPWKIVAILFKGNIYLCARDTPEKIYQKSHMTEQEKKFMSWGFKFEQYMLSDTPQSEPNADVPLDETKEFSLVFKTNLNRHTVIYGAEMDGILCDRDVAQPDNGSDTTVEYFHDKQFIELKTNRHFQFPKQETSFRRFKTKKWWCQSFLVGVDTIVCGFRNDDGIVEETKVYPVKELAKMSERFWKPNVCFNFLDTFFTFVKRCFARDIKYKHGDKHLQNIQTLPMMTLLFEWRPGMPVRVSDHYSHEDDPILPVHFIDNFGKYNECR